MRRGLVPVVVAAAVCLGVAGCTSSSGGSSPSAPATSPSSSSTPTGTPVAPTAIAATVQRGLSGVRSVHLDLNTKVAGGGTLTGAGDVALAGGTISKADLTEELPGGLGAVRLVVAGGQTYARLPTGLATSGKPWTRISSGSGNPLVAQLAGTVDGLIAVASPSTVVSLLKAATSVADLGPADLGGTAATHYRVVIPKAALSSLPGGLSAGGESTLPVDVYLDSSGRPAGLRSQIEFSGARLTPTVALSRYDEQVSITAPPDSRIAG